MRKTFTFLILSLALISCDYKKSSDSLDDKLIYEKMNMEILYHVVLVLVPLALAELLPMLLLKKDSLLKENMI